MAETVMTPLADLTTTEMDALIARLDLAAFVRLAETLDAQPEPEPQEAA